MFYYFKMTEPDVDLGNFLVILRVFQIPILHSQKLVIFRGQKREVAPHGYSTSYIVSSGQFDVYRERACF
jgi:hypothetical protein